jgi:hypothetical protein
MLSVMSVLVRPVRGPAVKSASSCSTLFWIRSTPHTSMSFEPSAQFEAKPSCQPFRVLVWVRFPAAVIIWRDKSYEYQFSTGVIITLDCHCHIARPVSRYVVGLSSFSFVPAPTGLTVFSNVRLW